MNPFSQTPSACSIPAIACILSLAVLAYGAGGSSGSVLSLAWMFSIGDYSRMNKCDMILLPVACATGVFWVT